MLSLSAFCTVDSCIDFCLLIWGMCSMMSQLISQWNRESHLITRWWRGGWSIYRTVSAMWHFSAFETHIWIQVVLASDLYRNRSEMSWCGQSRSLWTGTGISLCHLWHHQAKRCSLVQIPLCPPAPGMLFFISGLTHTELQSKTKQNKTLDLFLSYLICSEVRGSLDPILSLMLFRKV